MGLGNRSARRVVCIFACKYGDPEDDVKDTKPGTVANPTNTSCLLGRLMPWERGAGAEDLVIISRPMLCSFPLHASMKNSFGFPTSVSTSHSWRKKREKLNNYFQ